MKITFFGLTLSSSWGNGHATIYRALLRGLRRLGHDLVFYERDTNYYAPHRDLRHCDYCDLRIHSGWDEARRAALVEAANSDVVILGSYCPEGARIADDLLALERPLRVFYDLDTPITLGLLAEGNREHLRRNQLPHFDLVLSFVGGPILRELEKRWGARLARPLYGCVDPQVHARVPVQESERYRLSYMGTYAPDRQPKVDELFLKPAQALPGKQFLLVGSLYPWELQLPENVTRMQHLGPHQHAWFYSASDATLNITRAEMARWGYCPSGRMFEAAACGAPLLSDEWPGIAEFFTPGEELLVVHSASDVEQALRLPQAELHRLGTRARRRALEEHTGEHRAAQLVDHLEEAAARTSPRAARKEAS